MTRAVLSLTLLTSLAAAAAQDPAPQDKAGEYPRRLTVRLVDKGKVVLEYPGVKARLTTVKSGPLVEFQVTPPGRGLRAGDELVEEVGDDKGTVWLVKRQTNTDGKRFAVERQPAKKD